MNKATRFYVNMPVEEFHDLYVSATPEQQDLMIAQYLDEVEREHRRSQAEAYDRAFAPPPSSSSFDELTEEYYRLQKEIIMIDCAITWVAVITGALLLISFIAA